MRIIDETIANDLSGNSNIYTPITDLTSIPGAQIGEIDVNGSTQAYAHVSLSSFTDYDTFRTDLTAGEKYRLVFTPDDESKFYSNAVAWAQDASGSDSELIMNLIGLGLGPTFLGAASDFFRASYPDNSLQMALYTLIPFYGLAIAMFVGLAGTIRRRAAKEALS